jgi:hypothetical protein
LGSGSDEKEGVWKRGMVNVWGGGVGDDDDGGGDHNDDNHDDDTQVKRLLT